MFVGLMGTGKSTVAEAVAQRIGWPVRDSDADIEAATGRTVDELVAVEGVAVLHEREARHLLDVVASGRRCLLAAAASTIDDDRCLVALRGLPVVWLRAQLATMLSRFGSRRGRPRFGREPAVLLREQLANRGPRLAEVADLVVDVEGHSPDAIAELVIRRLRLAPAG